MRSYNLQQIITHSTRVTTTSATLIDHIWTDYPTYELKSYVIDCSITDHFPTLVCFHWGAHESSTTFFYYRAYNKDLLEPFNILVYNEYETARANYGNNVNQVFNYFYNALCDKISTIFPILKKKAKPMSLKCPWMTRNLLKCVRKKHRLFKQYRLNKINFNSYKIYRDVLIIAIKASKKLYYLKLFTNIKSNPKKYWNVANKTLGRQKRSEKISITENNDTIVDDKQIANKFNDIFTNNIKNIQSNIPKVQNNYINNIHGPINSFMLTPVTPMEVEQCLLKLKNNSFHAQIPVRILKDASSVISMILSELYNLCMSNFIFPDILKIARVLQIHKSQSKNDPNNYLPISILCPITKILES